MFILIVLKLIVKVVGPDSVEHEHFFFKLERGYFKYSNPFLSVGGCLLATVFVGLRNDTHAVFCGLKAVGDQGLQQPMTSPMPLGQAHLMEN